MRLPGVVVVLCATAASAQPTRTDVERQFGTPDAERYASGTGISAQAGYGTSGRVCELLIEPRPASIVTEDPNAGLTSLAQTDVDRILDDLVPAGTRIGVAQLFATVGGNLVTEAIRYDNLTITRVRFLPPWHEYKWAFVQWKEPACTLSRDDLTTRYGDADAERFPV